MSDLDYLDDEIDEAIGEGDEIVSTRFKVGNLSWRARRTHGRRPLFDDPDTLLEACREYLEWVSENPMISAEAVKFKGQGSLMMVPKMRAPTIRGLCVFLEISYPTWRRYAGLADFSDTCQWVESAIYVQKVEGAAAGLLDAGFIGREIGIADKGPSEDDEAKPVNSITYVEEDASQPE